MSNLTTKQRDALPASAFCDPGNRLFPVLDQADVDSAAHLIGKAKNPDAVKACIKRKAAAKGWKLPTAWQDDNAKHSTTEEPCTTCGEAVAVFSLGNEPATDWTMTTEPLATFDGQRVKILPDTHMVIRRGKIFEAGEFEDKNYAMTPEELIAATINFTPVPVDLEHTETLLDGKLGEVREIEVSEDGKTLTGVVALPKWLDDAIGDAERKVSATWNRTTKRLEKLALVRDPRVSDAAIMAAFAKRHDTPHGQMAMQELHDSMARHGAVCSQSNAQMASRHEATAIQQAHDLAVTHGAACHAISGNTKPLAMYGEPAPKPKGRVNMSWLNDLFKVAKEAPEDFDAEAAFSAMRTEGKTPATVTPPPAATMSAGPSDAERERDAVKKELAGLKAQYIQEQAAAFATKYIETLSKAFPAERDAIQEAYVIAAQDDLTYGLASFSNGTTVTRVAALTKAYESRPAHQLTIEQLHPQMQALFNQTKTPDPDARNRELPREELDKLLAQFSGGQEILRQRNGASR